MPTILCLLLLGLPIVAALALDTASFAWFLLLFCVAAGLTTSASDDSAFFQEFQNNVDKDGRGCQPRRGVCRENRLA
jgi:hypothetical protein